MNIVEVLKTGRCFRRKSDPDCFINPKYYDCKAFQFSMDEILADDWEPEAREFWVFREMGCVTDDWEARENVGKKNPNYEWIKVREVIE